jgi:hypothetical protein
MEHVMATVKAKEPDQGVPDRKHNIEVMRQDYYARISHDPALEGHGHAVPRRAGVALCAGGLAL